jgi:uncharacterized protein YybS (DUF2232 family)
MVMVFLTIAGLFASTQVPVLGALVLSFAGLPAFLIILAWGGIWFLAYSALTFILTGLVGNLSLAALMIPMLLVPAAVLSGALKMGFSPLKAVGATLLVATLFSTASWGLATGMDKEAVLPVEKQFAEQKMVVEQQLAKLEETGETTPENIESIRESVNATFDFLLLLVPATFIFIWHLISLAVIYVCAFRLAPRFGSRLASLPRFSAWRFDWNLIWLFIAGWVMFYLPGSLEGLPGAETIRVIGANCLAISKILYFIAGLSLLFFMFEKYRLGSLARVTLSCLALVLTQAMVWIGIIDVWFDFRTPKPALFASDDSDDDF